MSIGVMGPAALGEEIQTTIHRWLHNPVPHGWQYQVKNDLILNYEIGYEKQIVEIGHFFSIQSAAQIKAGTLINRVSGGFNFMAGHFRHKFSSDHSIARKPECYIYGQSRLHGTAYDASLQGGILNRSGLYSIASEDISRISFSADAGLVLNFKKVFFSYSQSFQTKEFKTGKPHRWGGVSIGFAL